MEVIPIPLTNLLNPVPNLRTRTYFIVDDRLDAEVLRKGLDDLVRNHWRKLAARAVVNDKKQFEFHLPKTFDDGYALFRWSAEETDSSIDKAVPALKRATSTDNITFFPSMHDIDSAFKPADWPWDRAEGPDEPVLFVHVHTFRDSTVISTSLLHLFGDQLAMGNIMKAWMDMVAGKAPPPLVGHDEEVMPHEKKYSDYSKKEIHRKGRLRVKRFGEKTLVGLGFIPDFIFHPKEEVQNMFLPVPMVDALREQVSKAVVEKYGSDPGISNGDIVTAIILKFSRMHEKKGRKYAASQTVNLRGRTPLLPADKAAGYIHNGMHYGTAYLRIDNTTPLSEIAYRNRKAVLEAMDPADIDIGMAAIREMVKRGQSIHTCEPLERSYSVTNWSSAWKNIAFENAAKSGTSDSEGNGKEYRKLDNLVLGEGGPRGLPQRYHSTVMCKADGGYWVDFAAPLKGMAAIKEYIAKDPGLKNF